MATYATFHRDRVNLAIHLVTVPLFVAGVVTAASQLAQGRILATAVGLLVPAAALAAQGRGHRREPTPPVPFRGVLDFARRVFVEQFYRFPRFVLTGEWYRAWRDGKTGAQDNLPQIPPS